MNLDDVGARVEMELPHPLEQHGLGDDPAGIAHQIFEHAEFLRLQLDRHAAAADGPAQQVHFEIADLQADLLDRHCRAAADRVQPGKQLGEREGLEKIVVGAGLQTLDAVIDAADRGEKENRRPDPFRAQGAHQGQAIEDRQHPVDDQHVVNARQCQLEPLGTALHRVDEMALLVEARRQVLQGLFVILDNKNSHQLFLWVASPDRLDPATPEGLAPSRQNSGEADAKKQLRRGSSIACARLAAGPPRLRLCCGWQFAGMPVAGATLYPSAIGMEIPAPRQEGCCPLRRTDSIRS